MSPAVTRTPTSLYADWVALRRDQRGLHGLEIADRLRVTECELVASACGQRGEIMATRLSGPMLDLIHHLPSLDFVKTVTRNRHAVIEVCGTYGNIEFFGPTGQSVSSVDLRIFSGRWAHAFAFREETRRGISQGFSFFDPHGVAIHKLFLRETSKREAYDALTAEFASPDQSPVQLLEPPATVPPPRPDREIDAAGLRKAWLELTDTHEFHGMLRKFGVARTQALRLAGEDLAHCVEPTALDEVLRKAAASETEIMVFVGNSGVIQIYSGKVHKIAPLGPWINVLDPGFDLHVRTDRVDSAWVVRKPTTEGFITSLELYAEGGEQIALLVGKRKHGQRENPAWRSILDGLMPIEKRRSAS